MTRKTALAVASLAIALGVALGAIVQDWRKPELNTAQLAIVLCGCVVGGSLLISED